MKIGFMADCHLGESKFRKMLNDTNEYYTVNCELFKTAINMFLEAKIDTLIIAGDLFDSPNPDINCIKIAIECFSKLMDNGTQIFLLGGNHEYSQKNLNNGTHTFDIFNMCESKIPIRSYFKEADCVTIGDGITISFLPYKCLDSENLNKLRMKHEKMKSFGSVFDILVFHGYIDYSENSDDVYALPKHALMENEANNSDYDLVICGHNHIQNRNTFKNKDGKEINFITPGSLMPSMYDFTSINGFTVENSIWTLDTDEGNKIQKIDIGAPSIIKYETNDSNVNETLTKISEEASPYNFYYIEYYGDIESVDQYLYKKAYKNSLNILLKIKNEDKKEPIDINDFKSNRFNFWKMVKDLHPEWEEDFKTKLLEI